jgi:3-deoxy-manno-octulosonate cytidylyltransferase (CMP-KDO synthetase)
MINLKKVAIIIPVRMGSSRFPGKPLCKIKKESMVQRIYNIAVKTKVKDVYVACCDQEVVNHLKKNKINYVITSKKHKRATERTAEALKKIEQIKKKKFNIIVMIQGDEPMITTNMIRKSLIPFRNRNVEVVNLICPIKNKQDVVSVNTVKVVKNKFNEAIFFSRSLIPNNFNKKAVNIFYKQVCIIPFKRNFLVKYVKLEPTKLEIIESIDMLRIIENGYKINLISVKKETFPVDTPQDLKRVKKLLKNE